MLSFTAIIEKFGAKGEKSGWTYVLVQQAFAEKLKPGMRQSFRVKGKLDELPVEHLALIPMGEGNFVLRLKADLRRKLRKQKGATLLLMLEADDRPLPLSEDFLTCLEDDPQALAHYQSLTGLHQRYFNKWIEEAKTDATKAKRIAQAIKGLSMKLDFGPMTKLNRTV